MNRLIQLKQTPSLFIITLSLAWFVVWPASNAFGVVPAPDGGYPGGNTAEGGGALFSLTTGTYNTAVGLFSLRSNAEGNFNTAVGAGALFTNSASSNTATGAGALLSSTGGIGFNTANAAFALVNNTTGDNNTGIGASALFHNTQGKANTAAGFALYSNTTGNGNTAAGFAALHNSTTGSNNIALGPNAGSAVTTASNVICIGAGIAGSDVSNTCFIGNIFNATSPSGSAVFVNSASQLGTMTSSSRFKADIRPIKKASEALFSLRPVRFRYKREVDPSGTSQLGLVAEDVEKVNRGLVLRDNEGKPYSVRYDQVNAMLLNEFLKELARSSNSKQPLRS
jgi:Chaperone of endosialidase